MDAYQPNNFRRNLFPHQLENIKNMEACPEERINRVLTRRLSSLAAPHSPS